MLADYLPRKFRLELGCLVTAETPRRGGSRREDDPRYCLAHRLVGVAIHSKLARRGSGDTVGYRHAAVRKGPGLNHLQKLRRVSMRVSLLPPRANPDCHKLRPMQKAISVLVFLSALSASPHLCGEEHFRSEAEPR